MTFTMTDEEILRSFNEAAKPAAQARVLADLNATSLANMCSKLKELGVDPKRLPRQRKEPEAVEDCPTEAVPAWKEVFRELGERQAGYSARMGEIEELLAQLQAERRTLQDKICDTGTALDVLLQVYNGKE